MYRHLSKLSYGSFAEIKSRMSNVSKVHSKESCYCVQDPPYMIKSKRVPALPEDEVGGIVINDVFAVWIIMMIVSTPLHSMTFS